MDPNTNDQDQQPEQPNITPPQPPVAPEQPAVTPVPQAAPAAYAPASVPQQKKSNKVLIIALAIGIPVLLLMVLLTFFTLRTYGAIQDKAKAVAFMSSMVKGDVDTAVTLTGDESSRSFLTTASSKIKGNSYALSGSEYNSKSDSYYLYALSGGEYTSARVIVTKEGGKRVISSFVYDTQALKLKPSSSATTTEQTQTTGNTTTQSTACFAPSDYSTALGYDNTLTFNETSPYTTNVHFLADSLEYDGSYQDEFLKTVAEIVSTNPGKGYTVRLYGSTATTAASDKSFANQRADKVKNALVAKGVDASKIIIDPAQNVDNIGGATSEVAKSTARVVVVQFIPACTATDSTNSSTGR